MSIGNLKDSGNQGNNFPWQYRMLLGLQSINDSVNASVAAAGPMAVDAFGRERISQPYTLGDYKHLYGLDPNFLDITANGGTVSFQANKACARLATTTTANSSAIHQTKFYHQYMPGKSQLIYSTFNFYAATAGVTKRTGYFDANNGIIFQQDGDGTLKFIIRTYTSGSAVDAEVVSQANWNVDKCNGSGPTGFNLDITKTQILFIDFQWLGVGKVRVGFVYNGQFIIAHEFEHSNILQVVYMSNPNLPVRCEIVSSGSNPAAYFDQICSTVISEGGYVESGQNWSALNTTLRSLTSGSSIPLFAIRLKDTFNTYANRMIVRLDNYNIFSTKEPLTYQIIKLPGIAGLTTGTSWVTVDTDSGVEYNVGATAYSGGDVLASGYVPASASGKEGVVNNANPSVAKKNYIVQNYASTDSEIYMVYVTNIGTTTTTVGASMQWREIY
jgi:hypothetical protein